MAKDRVVSNTVSEFEEVNLNPIFGYEDSSLLILEEAIKQINPFVPHLTDYVATAKKKCNQRSDILTQDESAAIYLYTMRTCFYSRLNETLRAKNRHALIPWFDFLKLFITALEKLPPFNGIVWRAVFGEVDSVLDDSDERIWWSVNSCSMDREILQDYLGGNGTLFAIHAVDAKDITAFSACPDEREVVLMPGTRLRAKCQSLELIDRLSAFHLEEISSQRGNSRLERNYLFEQIKQQYQRNSRIERFMNPSKTYSIEQSYINLAIVKAKEQHEKERQLQDARQNHTIINTFEEIYGTKTAIDVKDILDTCKTEEKKILILGRAGIGKSTFSQYIAHQWAKGLFWQQYQLLALIPLRGLTTNRYPSTKDYSLIDLIRREVLQCDLTEKDERILKKYFDPAKTLWILDGYDEIVQNVPPHLEFLFQQLLRTPHHIITSRPYLNTLSYDVRMEITGFTDGNILEYVKQFFDQLKDELADALIQSQTLLRFLRSNSRIWGLAHIPVNLELICSLWSNNDWTETGHISMTRLYSEMIEWLCRRYLTAQNVSIQQLTTKEVYQHCQKELAFLENLAFNAMKSNTIIIQPSLLEKAIDDVHVSSENRRNILNFGVLKSYDKQGTGNQIETKKDHYFIHLSLQEYFAARYLINAFKGPESGKAIQFIKHQKYNQRCLLVFTFAVGLLSESDATCMPQSVLDYILGEPLDLVGVRHIELIISCFEEISGKSIFRQHHELLGRLVEVIKYHILMNDSTIIKHLRPSLQKAQSLQCEKEVTDMFINLLQSRDMNVKKQVLSFMSHLTFSNPSIELLKTLIITLDDADNQVRQSACSTLGRMGEKAATEEIISKLMSVLEDPSDAMGETVCSALGNMGKTAATNGVISKLMSALEDRSETVRKNACKALGYMGEEAVTNEVINKLLSALEDPSGIVRKSACKALGNMGEKAASNEVISKLVSALEEDQSEEVKWNACKALGNIGQKAATNEVISTLVNALENKSWGVRETACLALYYLGKKAATNEVIDKRVSTPEDGVPAVRRNAFSALGQIGRVAATTAMIIKLVSALEKSEMARVNACLALGRIGEKAATNEVISKLVSMLRENSERMRAIACYTLGNMGEKAVTEIVINELETALEGDSEKVIEYAVKALGNMGEKAATEKVISKLVNALEGNNATVIESAMEALGKMGEKTATEEIISKLVRALRNPRESMRVTACKALGRMGEKAATDEVISKLVSVVKDGSVYIKSRACEALSNMCEKTATNRVISELADIISSHTSISDENIYSCFENISVEEVVEVFLNSENRNWFRAFALILFVKGAAVTVTGGRFIIYGDKEPIERLNPIGDFTNQFIETFIDQRNRLHLDLNMATFLSRDS